MKLTTRNNVPKIITGLAALVVLSLLGLVGLPWMAHAVDEGSDPAMQAAEGETASGDVCCKAGDTTPPGELVKLVAPGGLHSPYPDYAKLAKDDPDLVKQFRLPGCNECHGGTRRRRLLPGFVSGRVVLGQYRRRAVQARDAGLRRTRKAGFRALPMWQRARADAADGCLHQDLRPALEDHRLHSFHQSPWNESSRKGDPGKDGRRAQTVAAAIPALQTSLIMRSPRPSEGRFARRCEAGRGAVSLRVRRTASTRGGVGLPPGPLRGPARSWLTTARPIPNASQPASRRRHRGE